MYKDSANIEKISMQKSQLKLIIWNMVLTGVYHKL